jgi:hypothetical protein
MISPLDSAIQSHQELVPGTTIEAVSEQSMAQDSARSKNDTLQRALLGNRWNKITPCLTNGSASKRPWKWRSTGYSALGCQQTRDRSGAHFSEYTTGHSSPKKQQLVLFTVGIQSTLFRNILTLIAG